MMLRASAGSELTVMSSTISVSVAADDSPGRRRIRKQSSDGDGRKPSPRKKGVISS